MDRHDVERWVADYEQLWRTEGTDGLSTLFTEDIAYAMSPWRDPVVGTGALARLWEDERVSADEVFTMTSEVVAQEGDVAVVRAEVAYAASGTTWRDLWVLQFAPDGRCRSFEEWPFKPGLDDGH